MIDSGEIKRDQTSYFLTHPKVLIRIMSYCFQVETSRRKRN